MIGKYVTLPQVRSLLGTDRMPAFVRALKNSLQAWNTSLGSAQLVVTPSTRASIINDYWYYFVNQQLGGTAMVTLKREQFQRFLVVDDQLIIRFKLVDRNLRSRNYPTPTSKGWNNQLPLQGLPPLSRCEFGYRLTLTGTDIEDAFLLLRYGERLLWLWQVLGSRIDTFAIHSPLTEPGQLQSDRFAYSNYSWV